MAATIRPMRFLLAVLLSLSPLPSAEATSGDGPADSVTLLVRSDGEHSSMKTLADGTTGWSGWVRVEIPLRGTPEETAQHLERQLEAEVVVERLYPQLGPEDEPDFNAQWSLENTGQSSGKSDADIDAITAWPRSTGEGVVVAVVDSGVDYDHPELDSNMWANPGEVDNGLDDDGNGLFDDIRGWDFASNDDNPLPDSDTSQDRHATMVAGVIAAEVNGVGITGVAPEAELMNLRACDDGFCSNFAAANAIYYAALMGADIINLSFGGLVPEDEGDPLMEDAIDFARSRKVLVVTAAGNTPPEEVDPGMIIVPAELPGANNLAVTASDRDDLIPLDFAYYSANIELAAPGVEIRTTSTDPQSYAIVDGTSFSAPMPAGAAALIISEYPGQGYAGVIDRLLALSDKPSSITAYVPGGRLNVGNTMLHPFLDSVNHLFEGDIVWAEKGGVTKGCNPSTNTRFCPNENVSREVMAAFLNRALNLSPTSTDHFDDDDNSIFEDDINRLASAGITKGCGIREFCPKNVVDRGQMAAFLARAFGLTDNGGGDLFDDDDDSIFEHDIDRIGHAGITRGCNPPQNDLYCPHLPVDRGAMTAFLHRAFD